MAKRILIIDSGNGGRDFLSLILSRWIEGGASLKLWSANRQWSVSSTDKAELIDNCPVTKNLKLIWLEIVAWTIVKLRLVKLAWFDGCDTVILQNWPEKVLLSAWIKRLKLRLIWLETGEVDYDRLAPECRLRLVSESARAKVLAINEELISDLTNLGYCLESLRLVPNCMWPELDSSASVQKLARHFKLRKDYFTICAKLDWQDGQMAESLIKSLQLCLDVSPHFQLVLLGDGPAREQIRWLIKRYHLETQVWLLGDRIKGERSLESFAVLVIAGQRPDWDDFSLALTAREKNITVMGRGASILKDVLEAEGGRIVDLDDQQVLAQAWLGLYHNPPSISTYHKSRSKDLVSFEALADKLLSII